MERFYRGFVQGLTVELSGWYMITSNRESGFGRYDVMPEPGDTAKDDAVILKFKVQGPREKELSDTVSEALRQIEERTTGHPWRQKGYRWSASGSMDLPFAGKKC